jgi:hypothetical protein
MLLVNDGDYLQLQYIQLIIPKYLNRYDNSSANFKLGVLLPLGCGLDDPGFGSGKGKRFLSCPKHSDRFWDPFGLLSMSKLGLSETAAAGA